jgi:hypothetical protein
MLKTLVASIPSHMVLASVRRRQALLTIDSEPGSSIARALVQAKLRDQIAALRRLRLISLVSAAAKPQQHYLREPFYILSIY